MIRLRLFGEALGYILKLAAAAFAVPILFLIIKILEACEPTFKVRIGRFSSDRIAALAQSANWYLRYLAITGSQKPALYLLVSEKSANRQLMTMVKRRLHVTEHPFFLKLYKFARGYITNSKIWIDFPPKYSGYCREFNVAPPQLSFTREETTKGQQELLRMGIKPMDRFVCFQSRDKAYLNKAYPVSSARTWAYHDHRDSDIRNYLPAAEYLAAIGIFAIRVGYIVEHPINPLNPRIIDYSTNHRSDFMDIYLLANCKFFLGNNSGLFCVAQAFDVPVAAANWIPLQVVLMCKRDIFIPKKLWYIKEKRFLTFREILHSKIHQFCRTEEYTEAGIETIENTEDEITALANEMNARLDNKWVATKEDDELQQRFRSLFRQEHFSYGFPSRLGAEFLRQNKELLD